MSVYGGFATRQQETYYNKLIERLILLLADRIIKTSIGTAFIHSVEERTPSDTHKAKWLAYINKIYQSLVSAEKFKYMEPKFSYSLRPLILHFQININITSEDYTQPTKIVTKKEYEHQKINAHTYKTLTPYDSIDDNKLSQSLWVEQGCLNKPSTATNAIRPKYNEQLQNDRRFIPMALKYSMVVPASATNSIAHSRGSSLDKKTKKKRDNLIGSILRYAQ
jgi:hypothetical protein